MATYGSLKEFAIDKNIISDTTDIEQKDLADLVGKDYSFIAAQYYMLLIPKADIEEYQSDNEKILFVPMDKLTTYDRYIIGEA